MCYGDCTMIVIPKERKPRKGGKEKHRVPKHCRHAARRCGIGKQREENVPVLLRRSESAGSVSSMSTSSDGSVCGSVSQE